MVVFTDNLLRCIMIAVHIISKEDARMKNKIICMILVGMLVISMSTYFVLAESDVTEEDSSTIVVTEDNNNPSAETSQTPVTEYKDATTIRITQQALNEAGYNCGNPDGVAGAKTSQAITSYQTAKGITVNGLVTDELLQSLGIKDKISEASSDNNDMPSGMILDEDKWQAWQLIKPCTLYSFVKASKKADFTFSMESGQQEHHKVCTFLFKDGDVLRNLEQSEFYYGIENQEIIYTGLSTNNESTYLSNDFREACIRLMMGYNLNFDSDTKQSLLNLTRERAEEIVNYCFENNIKHCLIDNMRIRLIRNDFNDNYYSFHMEYSEISAESLNQYSSSHTNNNDDNSNEDSAKKKDISNEHYDIEISNDKTVEFLNISDIEKINNFAEMVGTSAVDFSEKAEITFDDNHFSEFNKYANINYYKFKGMLKEYNAEFTIAIQNDSENIDHISIDFDDEVAPLSRETILPVLNSLIGKNPYKSMKSDYSEGTTDYWMIESCEISMLSYPMDNKIPGVGYVMFRSK